MQSLKKFYFGKQKKSIIYYKGEKLIGLNPQFNTNLSPDGTKLYLSLHNGPDGVGQYVLPTPWKISVLGSYSRSLTVNQNGETAMKAHVFSTDGTKLFIAGESSNSVLSYQLSTPWQVSTAAYVGFKNVGIIFSIAFSSDGMYFFKLAYGNPIYRYPLTIAWDISTITTSDQSVQLFNMYDMFFSPDGLMIFGIYNRVVYRYSLLTPFNLIGSYGVQSINLQSVIPLLNFDSVTFSSDGMKMFVGQYVDSIYAFELTKPFDINSKLIII
jgi:hypothetical protein